MRLILEVYSNRSVTLQQHEGQVNYSRVGINLRDGVTVLQNIPVHPKRAFKSVQTEAYHLFSRAERCQDFEKELMQKLVITLGDSLSRVLSARTDWFECLKRVLSGVKVQARVALFKTFVGAWTTSCRMHEPNALRCLFGCADQPDTLSHYLHCTPLWMIGSENLTAAPPFRIEERLCINRCCSENVILHAVVYHTYHYVKAQLLFDANGGHVQPTPAFAQKAASEASRTFYAHLA